MIFDIQSRLMPATTTASCSGLIRATRIGGHHDRLAVGFGEQKIAEDEIACLLRLPEIVAVAEMRPTSMLRVEHCTSPSC